mgnify:CR=1 FL=1|tara:strand:+ start:261 stop:434 length:174 start_codon:yes stop_codon:yes gene_type:complete
MGIKVNYFRVLDNIKEVDNAIGMHASIKGIAGNAGNAIHSIPALELEEELEGESEDI